jgi:hypothetical protein
MYLVARGVLDLDRPVRAYLPELRLADADATEQVTLRHLLSHTGGWVGDYFDDTGWGDDAAAVYVERMVDLPQLTPVGELWSYSNSGFVLARPRDRGGNRAAVPGRGGNRLRPTRADVVVVLAVGGDDAPLRRRTRRRGAGGRAAVARRALVTRGRRDRLDDT